MTHREEWFHRGKCGACRAPLWIDSAARLVCLCGESWIEADGTLGGKALRDVTDEEIVEFLKIDSGHPDVQLVKLEKSKR